MPYPYHWQDTGSLDLGRIFLLAAQAREARENANLLKQKTELLPAQEDREQALNAANIDYKRAQANARQVAAAKDAVSVQDQRWELAKKRGMREARMMFDAATEIKNNISARPFVVKRILNAIDNGMFDMTPEEVNMQLSPENINSTLQNNATGMKMFSDPMVSNTMKNVLAEMDYADNPELGMRDEAFPQAMNAALERLNKTRIAINNNMPGKETSELDRPMTRKVQGDLLASSEQLSKLNSIWAIYKPEYLTWAYKIADKGGSWMAKLGMSPRELSEMRRDKSTFDTRVEKNFSEIVHGLTGAAFTVGELQRYRNWALNTDMDSDKFEGAFREFYEATARAVRLSRRILRDRSLDLTTPGGPGGARLDALMRSGDNGNSKRDKEDRLDELMKLGLSPEEIVLDMMSEGYIDRASAPAILRRLKNDATPANGAQ